MQYGGSHRQCGMVGARRRGRAARHGLLVGVTAVAAPEVSGHSTGGGHDTSGQGFPSAPVEGHASHGGHSAPSPATPSRPPAAPCAASAAATSALQSLHVAHRGQSARSAGVPPPLAFACSFPPRAAPTMGSGHGGGSAHRGASAESIDFVPHQKNASASTTTRHTAALRLLDEEFGALRRERWRMTHGAVPGPVAMWSPLAHLGICHGMSGAAAGMRRTS